MYDNGRMTYHIVLTVNNIVVHSLGNAHQLAKSAHITPPWQAENSRQAGFMSARKPFSAGR